MTDSPPIPYEAFFNENGEPTNALTWTPPPPEPEPDIYDDVIATVRQLKEAVHPTPPPTRDDYLDYFPNDSQETNR